MLKRNLFLLFFILTVPIAKAQDTTATKKENKWQFQLTPYLVFPNMKGTVGIGNLPDASIDLSPGDIFNHLQMGAMLYMEARKDKWAITSDFLYMKLGQDIVPNKIINSGDATMKQTIWEGTGLYKVYKCFEVGVGVRVYSMNGTLNVNYKTGLVYDTARTESATKTWADPIIVTRFKFFQKTKWIAELRTDVGGFGIGSKLAWQVQADVGYRFSKLFFATIGYRYLDVDYESGSDANRFLYDMATFGPSMRFGFNF